jgi:hypothetical protein
MIISNIGTIVLSLNSERSSSIGVPSSAVAATATQVRLISVSNTLSRIVSGPLADLISPVNSRASGELLSPPPRYRISKVALLSFIPLLLAGTFLYMELAVRTPGDLWILRYAALLSALLCRWFICYFICYLSSVNTGAAYGITFTILCVTSLFFSHVTQNLVI